MCEVLLCVKNLGKSGDLSVDSHAPQQGDIVCVQPDGWSWGDCELGIAVPGNPNGNHNFFRIIKLPNVTVKQASNLLTPEADTAANVQAKTLSPYLQYRAFFLDKTKIPAGMAALAAHVADDLRTNPFVSLPYTAAQIQTLVTQRTPIPFT